MFAWCTYLLTGSRGRSRPHPSRERRYAVPRMVSNEESLVLELARRMGMIEAVEVMAGALRERLAADPGVPDGDLDALERLAKECHRRRQAANAATE